jgi:hypothetical protein
LHQPFETAVQPDFMNTALPYRGALAQVHGLPPLDATELHCRGTARDRIHYRSAYVLHEEPVSTLVPTDLNLTQQRAATHCDCRLLMSAGTGIGKTKTLVTMGAYLTNRASRC